MSLIRGLPSAALLATALALGCNATVHRTNGPPLDGEIMAGDDRAVTLLVDGQRVVVQRHAIEEIDHPGNVLAIVGLVPISLGTLIVAGDLALDGEVSFGGGLYGLLFGLLGLPSFVVGGIIWTGSRGREQAAERPDSIGVGPGGIWVRF